MELMLAGLLALVCLAAYAAFAAIGYIAYGLWKGGEWLVKWHLQRGDRRRARIEAELDRTQAELRSTILNLADALGVEAHEARKALIRESYLASGRTPGQSE